MSMVSVLLGFGQKCLACGQTSNPRSGHGGQWEVMGLWAGAIHRCKECEHLIRIGFIFDELLSDADAKSFLAARQADLNKFEQQLQKDIQRTEFPHSDQKVAGSASPANSGGHCYLCNKDVPPGHDCFHRKDKD